MQRNEFCDSFFDFVVATMKLVDIALYKQILNESLKKMENAQSSDFQEGQ